MLIKVNGRTKFFNHLHDFGKGQYSYEWTVKRNDVKYTIWGGKRSGGTRNEWYVENAYWNEPIRTKSIMDSLNLLDTM